MPTCKACDRDIEVKWIVPVGTTIPLLESLCNICLQWADIAKSDEKLLPPNARRKPLCKKEEESYHEESG